MAIAFHRMFRFRNVVNGYIPSRGYMPVGYGQLGCSGFIVSDKQGCFVSRKTAAYLQLGEQAFARVEQLLVPLVPKGQVADVSVPKPAARMARGNTTRHPKKIEAPDSVGVDSMDEEHRECVDAFNQAIEKPSISTLQQLLDIRKSHFDHEEELIKRYGNNSATFSALDSHSTDHQRILKIAVSELERVNGCGLTGQ